MNCVAVYATYAFIDSRFVFFFFSVEVEFRVEKSVVQSLCIDYIAATLCVILISEFTITHVHVHLNPKGYTKITIINACVPYPFPVVYLSENDLKTITFSKIRIARHALTLGQDPLSFSKMSPSSGIRTIVTIETVCTPYRGIGRRIICTSCVQ